MLQKATHVVTKCLLAAEDKQASAFIKVQNRVLYINNVPLISSLFSNHEAFLLNSLHSREDWLHLHKLNKIIQK